MSRVIRTTSVAPQQASCPDCQAAQRDSLVVDTTYDPEGMPLIILRHGSGDVSAGVGYWYDAAGRMTSHSTEQLEQVYTYDPAGNLIAHSRGGETILMEYDAASRLTRRVVPAVQFSQSTCYPFMTLCGYTFPLYPNAANGSLIVPADTQLFAYDTGGRMTLARNRDAIIERSYFPDGLLRTDTIRIRRYDGAGPSDDPCDPEDISCDPDPCDCGDPTAFGLMSTAGQFDLHVYGIAYSYDGSGRRASLTYPTNLTGGQVRSTSYAYRSDSDELATVTAPENHQWQFIYNAAGRDTLRIFPGGQELRLFDADGQLRYRSQSASQAGGLRADSYRYDARGKPIHSWSGIYEARNWYGGLGALVASVFTGYYDSYRTDYSEEFTVDALGNVITQRRHDTGYSASPRQPWHRHTYSGEALQSIELVYGQSLHTGMTANNTFNEFDDRGNVVFMGDDRFVVNPYGNWEASHHVATRSFWSADNRLVAHQRYSYAAGQVQQSEGVFDEYRYDALGRRILSRSRADSLCTGHAACHSAITRFVWAGDQLLVELRAPGGDNVSAAALENTTGSSPQYGRVFYIHGPQIDRPLGIVRDAAFTSPIVPHTNWRGSYDMATNANGSRYTGAVDWPGRTRRSYFDSELDSKPASLWLGSLILDMRDATGLLYRRNRYFDPTTGRFTQEDPIGLAGGLNTYGFAGGDPISYSDPFGLCPEYAGGDGRTPSAADCPREVLDAWAATNVRLDPGVSWEGVDPTLRDAVIMGSIDLNMPLDVSSTNGGTHGRNSNHYSGHAVDIAGVNGQRFRQMDDATAFQVAPVVAGAVGAHIPEARLREFIGPDMSIRFHRAPWSDSVAAGLREAHRRHVHISILPPTRR